MSVDLSHFEPVVWAEEKIQHERALFALAISGDDGAAAELQFWRTRFGKLEDQNIEAELREFELAADRERMISTTKPNKRDGREWHHLDAFGVAIRSKRPKSTAKLLELRHAHGIMLTTDDLRSALTTIFDVPGKAGKKPRRPCDEWAETVGDVEATLVAYVRHMFKGTSEEAALTYVRDSFPMPSWADKPDEEVDYPRDW
jgi:hypothetical protein